MRKILFIINDGFEEAETINPYDVLNRAGYDITIASNKTEALGAHNIKLTDLKILSKLDLSEFDLVVLPGGPQWANNQKDIHYLNAIKYFITNKALASICATPTILGNLGLLKDKTYTCFPPMNKDFNGKFSGRDAEIDGNLITGRAAGSSLEFAYKIVEYLDGIDYANKIKENMYY